MNMVGFSSQYLKDVEVGEDRKSWLSMCSWPFLSRHRMMEGNLKKIIQNNYMIEDLHKSNCILKHNLRLFRSGWMGWGCLGFVFC